MTRSRNSTSADVVRIHGDANLPPVVCKELAGHVQNCDASQSRCDCATWELPCAESFAKANGWRVHHGRWPDRFGGLDFHRKVLPLTDHATLFREGGRITAVLSHDYNPNRDFSALGEYVVVDQLPRSWYWRGGVDHTTAFLLRPAVSP